jgi:hypothetical protein
VSARYLRVALAVAVAVAVLGAMPAISFGAAPTAAIPVTTTAASITSPAASGSVVPAAAATPSTLEVQFWPAEADGALLIVGAELPSQTKLPATVRLPLPAGATLSWVGEVFGGDPNADTEVAYIEEKGEGGAVLVVTLTKSRSVQYEATLPAPSDAAGRKTAAFTWVQAASGPEVGLSVKMAATAGDARIVPGAVGPPRTNAAGELLYTLPPARLALGKSAAVSVSWVVVAPGSTIPGSSGGSSTTLYVLVGLLVAAVLALAVVMAVARGRARG